MSRQRIELDENQLAAMCRLVASMEDCALYFNCSEDTIRRRVKEWGYESFASFRKKNMNETRFQLKRDAIERSKTSDAVLIFALKNLCGWKDKNESEQEHNVTVHVKSQDAD